MSSTPSTRRSADFWTEPRMLALLGAAGPRRRGARDGPPSARTRSGAARGAGFVALLDDRVAASRRPTSLLLADGATHAAMLAPGLVPHLGRGGPLRRSRDRSRRSVLPAPATKPQSPEQLPSRDEQTVRAALRALARIGTARAAALVALQIQQDGPLATGRRGSALAFPAGADDAADRRAVRQHETSSCTTPRTVARIIDRVSAGEIGDLDTVLEELEAAAVPGLESGPGSRRLEGAGAAHTMTAPRQNAATDVRSGGGAERLCQPAASRRKLSRRSPDDCREVARRSTAAIARRLQDAPELRIDIIHGNVLRRRRVVHDATIAAAHADRQGAVRSRRRQHSTSSRACSGTKLLAVAELLWRRDALSGESMEAQLAARHVRSISLGPADPARYAVARPQVAGRPDRHRSTPTTRSRCCGRSMPSSTSPPASGSIR